MTGIRVWEWVEYCAVSFSFLEMRIHCGIFLGKWVSGGVEELAAKNAKGAKK